MKRENAYFTVEAAMVMPMVISVLLFVVYLFLFQYDRCLLEQDLGGFLLWGSRAEASDIGALEQMLRERIEGLYREKYAGWDFTMLNVKVERNRIIAEGSGQLTFPASGWNFWSQENVWSTEAVYSGYRFSPVSFIRLCHKFQKD